MNSDKYRVVSFDQGGRLAAGNAARLKIIQDAIKDPQNEKLLQAAKVPGAEFAAVHKSGGVCEALSLKWLKTKFKENNQQWAMNRQNAATRVGLIDRDKTFDRAFARYAASDSKPFGLEGFYGLNAVMDLKMAASQYGSTSYVARTVGHSQHGYYLHQIKCPAISATGTHALAYYTSSGKMLNVGNHVYMFDPDYGEYKVANSAFIDWMPKFLKYFYGTLEADTVVLKVVGLANNKRPTP